jgi:hypothetical protein
MTYKEFQHAIVCLEEFYKERQRIDDLAHAISPHSTLEFGAKFIDDYVWLLETAMNDEDQWISWFVFENDFGRKGLTCKINDKEYKITTAKKLYNVCLKFYNETTD